jgi:hypothetical protein
VSVGFPEALTCVMCSRILLNVRGVHKQLEVADEPRSEHAMRDLPLSPIKETSFVMAEEDDHAFDTTSTSALHERIDVGPLTPTRIEFKTELTIDEVQRLRRLRTR